MQRQDAKRIENIASDLKEGLIHLEKAAEYFREAYRSGSGMGELLLRRTVFTLFIHDREGKDHGNRQ